MDWKCLLLRYYDITTKDTRLPTPPDANNWTKPKTIQESIKVVFGMRPRFAECKLCEHLRHALNLFISVILSIAFASFKQGRLMDLILLQEVEQHVLRLVEVGRVILIV